jgi:type II secretory pathway pseudopilin PulG
MVEVVLLLVILGIALMPLTRLSVTNLKFGAQYSLMSRAMAFAQERMEEIISDYQATSAGRGYNWVQNNWNGVTDAPAASFTRTVSISSQATLNGVNYVTVRVTVSHSEISDTSLETILVE